MELSAYAPSGHNGPDNRPPVPAAAAGDHGMSTGTGGRGIREAAARVRKSVRREVSIVAASVFLGIAVHVVYIFIQVMLPVQESGAARFGERFVNYW